MRTFQNVKRVRIRSGMRIDGKDASAIAGKTAVLKRRNREDDAAWFELETEIPESLRFFSKSDADGRANHLMLYPGQCDPA